MKAMVVPTKGKLFQTAERATETIDEYGYSKIVFKTNQAPAIIELQEEAKSLRLNESEGMSKKLKSVHAQNT